jgi:hypothetical protein
LWLDEPFDLAREIYRYLSRSTSDGDSVLSLLLPEISMTIAEWVESGNEVTQAEIDRCINDCLEKLSVREPLTTAFWAYDLAAELAQPEQGKFDASSFKQRRLARASAVQDVLRAGPSTDQ